jgi:hypothetical protein
MAGLDYLLKEYKTACGNTVNVGDVVMNRSGCHFYIVVGIGLNNKSSEPNRWNGRVLLKHYSDKDDYTSRRYFSETNSLDRYYLVKDGVLILKPV